MSHHCDHELSCGCHNLAAEALVNNAIKNGILKTDSPATASPNAATQKPAPLLLIHNNDGAGTIRTVVGGDGNATTEAILVYQDEIVFSGAPVDAQQAAKNIQRQDSDAPALEIRALEAGQCVIPGMIESHLHLTTSPVMLEFNDYSPFGDYPLSSETQCPEMTAQRLRPNYNLSELKNALLSDVQKVKSGWWLLGDGVDVSLMSNFPDDANGKTLLDCIDKSFLDAISSDIPILLISASEHTAYANTPALEAIWQKNETELRKRYSSENAYITQTNGVLQELAEMTPAMQSIHKEQLAEIALNIPKNLIKMLKVAQQRGVTMVYDAGMQDSFEKIIHGTLVVEKNLFENWPCPRIGMAKLVATSKDVPTDKSFSAPTKPDAKTPYNIGSLNLYYGSLKIVSDGSNQGLTGYQIDPYACPPENNYGLYNFATGDGDDDGDTSKGTPINAPVEFIDLVGAAWQNKWPLMVHANGERAIEYVLQAYGGATAKYSDISADDLRNRIEHCSLLTDDRLERIAELKINPSFLIGHVGYWGWTFDNYIFKQKAEQQLDRCNSAALRNICFTLHSDCAVSPLGPLRMMEQAVTRKMEGYRKADGTAPTHDSDIPVLNDQERITSAQALAAVTFNSAWQCHADHLIGSLEAGKLADLVILAEDPVTMNADSAYMKMRDIAVIDVLIGGQTAFVN